MNAEEEYDSTSERSSLSSLVYTGFLEDAVAVSPSLAAIKHGHSTNEQDAVDAVPAPRSPLTSKHDKDSSPPSKSGVKGM